MNTPIRRVALAITVLLVALVGQLTYLQVVDAKKLANDPRNIRKIVGDFERPRGSIVTADGKVVARSVPSSDGFKYQRLYPMGPLYAEVSGYQSFIYGNTGVEASYNDALTGRSTSLRLRSLGNLLLGKPTTGNLVLTLQDRVQQVARAALGAQRGTVIALDPRTGGVLAMYSNPTFDPQPLAGHDAAAVQAAFNALVADPANPALPRAFREIYPPGSTYKTVTSAVGLETGTVTPASTFPVLTQLPLPQSTHSIANFGHEACGGTLVQSFIVSCNTTFAQLGLDLGELFPPGGGAFGIGAAPPLDVAPGAVASSGPVPGSFALDKPAFAESGIGQFPVDVTPLQMALVAEAVADHGVVMAPHVGAQITDPDGNVLEQVPDRVWRTAMPAPVAAELTQMMIAVVQQGTGTPAQISGVPVAGKTGTAEVDQGNPHAWFIAFAPADAPQVAVAVLVEHGGNFGSEATGGQVAAPIARQVILAALGR